MILSHITKILENTIKNKLEQNLSNLIHTGEYYSGFKAKISTKKNLSIIINQILKNKTKRKDRKIIISLDIQKANDSVDR